MLLIVIAFVTDHQVGAFEFIGSAVAVVAALASE